LKDLHIRLLSFGLAAFGLTMAYYKAEHLGLPLRPGTDAPVWTVEARIKFTANGAVKTEFMLPRDPPGFWVLDEDFISSNFGLVTEGAGSNRKAKWAVRRATGAKALYYRLTLYEDPKANLERAGAKPPYPARPDYPEPKKSAIEAVLEQVRSESADIATFTQELLKRLSSDTNDENIDLLRDSAPTAAEWAQQVVEILAGARIPARLVWGLRLREGLRHGDLEPVLEVHNSREWLAFDPSTGRRGFPDKFLVWRVGDTPLVSITGGSGIRVEFSAASRMSDLVTVAQKRGRVMRGVDDAVQREHGDFRGAAADVEHHRPARFVHGQARADRGRHGLTNNLDAARAGAFGRLLDGATFDLGGADGHAHQHARGRFEHAIAMHLADEVLQHLLGVGEVGDDAVFHRADRVDVARSAAQHVLGFGADGDYDLAAAGVVVLHRDNGRLIEHDALVTDINEGIGRSQVD
jgi:hypothetical protein